MAVPQRRGSACHHLPYPALPLYSKPWARPQNWPPTRMQTPLTEPISTSKPTHTHIHTHIRTRQAKRLNHEKSWALVVTYAQATSPPSTYQQGPTNFRGSVCMQVWYVSAVSDHEICSHSDGQEYDRARFWVKCDWPCRKVDLR